MAGAGAGRGGKTAGAGPVRIEQQEKEERLAEPAEPAEPVGQEEQEEIPDIPSDDEEEAPPPASSEKVFKGFGARPVGKIGVPVVDDGEGGVRAVGADEVEQAVEKEAGEA